MKKTREFQPAIGGTALLVMFAVLGMTMLALLSLNTVLSQRQLTENALDSVTAYYQADLEAEKIYARLRAGEQIPGVTREGSQFHYRCPISPNQALYVSVENTGVRWTVLRWQAVVEPETIDDILPVWDGQAKEASP